MSANGWPSYWLKLPPITSMPSAGWTTTVSTSPLAPSPEINGWVRRAGRHQAGDAIARDAIDLGELADQNNRLSACNAMPVNRAARSGGEIRVHGPVSVQTENTIKLVPLKLVKLPPTSTRPSSWMANAWTECRRSRRARFALKFVSSEPSTFNPPGRSKASPQGARTRHQSTACRRRENWSDKRRRHTPRHPRPNRWRMNRRGTVIVQAGDAGAEFTADVAEAPPT